MEKFKRVFVEVKSKVSYYGSTSQSVVGNSTVITRNFVDDIGSEVGRMSARTLLVLVRRSRYFNVVGS